MRRGLRVLSVEVTGKGFSFAVLEGTERLVDWGGREVAGDVSLFIGKLGKLIDRYRPDTLVLEEPAGSRKGTHVRERIVWADQYAADIGLARRAMRRDSPLLYFSETRLSKHELAVEVARQFPELAPRVPKPRKPWQSEARSIPVFVAVARGCAAVAEWERSAGSPS